MAADNANRLISKIVRERSLDPVLLRGVTPDWFLQPDDRRVFDFLLAHYQNYGEVPTGITVKDNFPTYRLLSVEDSLEYLVDQLVAHRRAHATLRMVSDAADLLDPAAANYEDVITSLRTNLAQLDSEAVQASDLDLVADPISRYEEYLARKDRPDGLLGLPTGFPTIDRATAGLQPGQLVTIIASPKTGKAMPLDTPVLTPGGWVRMGDLKVGSKVIGSDGMPTDVIAVHPQGVKQIFRVTADDGGTTECCGEHLWEVHPHGWSKSRVIDTHSLRGRIADDTRFAYLPLHSPVPAEDTPIPLDPWVVGALLGDGYTAKGTVGFTQYDSLTVAAMRALLPEGVLLRERDGHPGQFLLVTPRGAANPLLDGVRELGMVGNAWDKHLPQGFEAWSPSQRWRLLAGLMDTDGAVDKKTATITSTSKEMAFQIQTLVWSLGGTARVAERSAGYRKEGSYIPCRTAYRVNLRVGRNPFMYSARVAKWDGRGTTNTRPPTRRIVSIEPSRYAEAQCITVANSDGLYVTEDYLVTHNSQLALKVASHIHEQGHTPLFQSFEMSNLEQQERFDALRAQVSHNRLRRGLLTETEEQRYRTMLETLGDTSFLLADSAAGTTVSAMAAKVSQRAPAVLFVDGVYLMIDEVTGETNTPQALTNITRSFKRLAQRLHIPIVLTTQTLLWKMRKNQISENSIGYSSSFLQDSDVVLGLERIEDEDDSRLLKVVASRNCGPASVECTWDWASGIFEEVEGTGVTGDDFVDDDDYVEEYGAA